MSFTFKGITFTSSDMVLDAVIDGKISRDEGKAVNAQLDLQAKSAGQKEIEIKTGPSGGVQVNGLGQFPVTLYRNQWIRLAGKMTDILDYCEQHKGSLSTGKDDKRFEASKAAAKAAYEAKKNGASKAVTTARTESAQPETPIFAVWPCGVAIGPFANLSQARETVIALDAMGAVKEGVSYALSAESAFSPKEDRGTLSAIIREQQATAVS